MGESNPSLKSCRQIIGEDPWWAIRTAGIACVCWLVLAALIAWGVHSYVVASEPEPAQWLPDPKTGLLYEIVPREVGGAWLFLRYKLDPSPSCFRETTTLVYRDHPISNADDPDGGREYFPLSVSLNGAGMPGVVSTFKTRLLIPVEMPSGDWQLVWRAHYGCPPLELITHKQSLGPMTIHIP